MENRARRRTTFFKGGVGWGGVGIIPHLSLAPLLDLHLHLHVTLLDLHLHLHVTLSDLHFRLHVALLDLYLVLTWRGGVGWGGVGWGGVGIIPNLSLAPLLDHATRSSLALTCYATRSSLALTCYAIRSSFALTCYATRSLLGFWHEGVGWGGVGIMPNLINLSLAPLLDLHLQVHVTLLDLHFHLHVTLLDLHLHLHVTLLDLHLHLHVTLSDLHLRLHVTLLDLYILGFWHEGVGWGGVGIILNLSLAPQKYLGNRRFTVLSEIGLWKNFESRSVQSQQRHLLYQEEKKLGPIAGAYRWDWWNVENFQGCHLEFVEHS